MVWRITGSILHSGPIEPFLVLAVLSHHNKGSDMYCHVCRKEGNVLFNDALNTFYLRLFDVEHMVKDHSNSERKPTAATKWAMLFD